MPMDAVFFLERKKHFRDVYLEYKNESIAAAPITGHNLDAPSLGRSAFN